MKNFALVLYVIALATGGAAIVKAAEPPPHDATAVAPKPGSPQVKNVGVEEFDKLRANKNNIVLDVRTMKEFQTGHIPGATNIDVNSSDFEQKIAALDKKKTYLVHCGAGVRSAKACDKMSKLDFQHLINLESGFNGWQKAGKP